MHLLYYITPHGFGHGIRTCAICNELSPGTKLTIRTGLPKRFFDEEISRPFDFAPATLDCGCVQNDGLTVDIPATVTGYCAIAEANRSRLHAEVAWCRDHHIDGIVADTTPFAFDVAYHAALPSICVTNFTWLDIFEPYARQIPAFLPYVEEIRRQYGRTDLLLALKPAMEMGYFTRRIEAPVVAFKGKNIRSRILHTFGLHDDHKLALIYTGNFGMDSMAWERIERFEDWFFIGLYPLPGNPENYYVVEKDRFRYADLIASSDLCISKIGYGTVAICMVNDIPLMYPPRSDFAEYPVLAAAVREWGKGYAVTTEAYYSLDWQEVLARIPANAFRNPIPENGAATCARKIENHVNGGR
ncbi:MAG: hypothetical protein GF398_20595 [Chitinivibrionales bacterium]|nr:hypothetical protein [Chitinivibrionales bacterium]